ncbi:ParB N-terminal domain-containing protein [Rhodococcus ruber]|uniref:ParB N-terminal domain-containing protein n=1 Tax=Actinomycetes TaxID=1760 RepID=UPI001785B1C3|nr:MULTISPECIES: ParB N-terminal domain-containing protein [Actinomycetes]MBD8054448.1 ParB N-terminal domain-containing protein [Rhodococcus ruber]QYF98303.1 ParB N-terminal domain-containing protein [Microbacterium sp. PAMC21962]
MSEPGHIELERSVASIWAGRRHREDYGDVDALIESIVRDGLLQPITITPDGMLICGARRLAAIRKLGWKTVNVWVRSGISTTLGLLLAEQDDNLLHKPLTRTEEATLYAELKALMVEDAAGRQEASRFTSNQENPRSHGAATVAAPQKGDTRQQAALMVTGRNAYTSLERINDLQRLTADPAETEDVRQRAQEELDRIDAGGSITGARHRIRAAQALAELDTLAGDPAQPARIRDTAAAGAARLRELEHTARPADLERLAELAVERAKTATKKRPAQLAKARLHAVEEPAREFLPVRSFVYLWDELSTWSERYDPDMIGPALSDEQWSMFENAVAATIAFLDAARVARNARRDTA